MAQDRFLIAPFEKGQVSSIEPFLIPERAFSVLQNAYLYRGRISKRFGARQLFAGELFSDERLNHLRSRFNIEIGETDDDGNATVSPDASLMNVGVFFVVNNTMFTYYQQDGALLSTDPNEQAQYDSNTNDLTITNAEPSSPIYFYPCLPVMGLIYFESEPPFGQSTTFGFDTRYTYEFKIDGWRRSGNLTFSGTDSDFVSGASWIGDTRDETALYIVNNNPTDSLRYYNPLILDWQTFEPVINNDGDILKNARAVTVFKDRLLYLNVVEERANGDIEIFPNRLRYSGNLSPLATNAFNQNVKGNGSFIDAPTTQAIIGVKRLKDRLIVYFERSTWEVVFTRDISAPFVWQSINSELGSESHSSLIPFDDAILGVGDVGVHACTGTSVKRIDDDIPDTVFNISQRDNGFRRVYGIREYFTEMAYWAYPDRILDGKTYPNKVLGYNYDIGAWSENDDSITCFGYFFDKFVGDTWGELDITWGEADRLWSAGNDQLGSFKVIAGNQQGATFLIEPKIPRNSASLVISNIEESVNPVNVVITSINHNLQINDFVYVENIDENNAVSSLNNSIFEVEDRTKDTITIRAFIDDEDYTGGATLTRVSRVDIQTKDLSFYLDKGVQSRLSRVDFMVDRTNEGEIAVEFYNSTSSFNIVSLGLDNLSALGTYILETRPYELRQSEFNQNQVWHPLYLQANATFIKLRLFFNDLQMVQPDISLAPFRLHAMMFHASQSSLRLG